MSAHRSRLLQIFLGVIFLSDLFYVLCVRVPRKRIRYNSNLEANDTPPAPVIKGPNAYFNDFERFVHASDKFVDKSMLIYNVCLERHGTILIITRPRRSGKSLNMNMVKRFVQLNVDENGTMILNREASNFKLFFGGEVTLANGEKKVLKQLQIHQYKNITDTYFGKYPVIYFSFSDIMLSDAGNVRHTIIEFVIDSYNEHPYIKERVNKETRAEIEKCTTNGTAASYDLPHCLRYLCKVLFEYFGKKVYVLIDDYEMAINYEYFNSGHTHSFEEFYKVVKFLDDLYTSLFHDNLYLEKAILNGVTPFAETEFMAGLKNVKRLTLLDPDYSQFYGFSENEVENLLKECQLERAYDNVKNCYKGYNVAGYLDYNPYSIVRCIDEGGTIYSYWLNTGKTSFFDDTFLSEEIQEDFRHLVQGTGIIKQIPKGISFKGIEDKKSILYSVLVCSGYLNAVPTHPKTPNKHNDAIPVDPKIANEYNLTIPNKEVEKLYTEKLTQWVTELLNISEYTSLTSKFTRGKFDDFREELQGYLEASSNVTDMKTEKEFQNIMSWLLLPMSENYVIQINSCPKSGRYGHVLLPRVTHKSKAAFVVEYRAAKTNETLESTAEEVLKLVKERQAYDVQIKEQVHIKFILKVGFSFYKKEIFSKHEVIKLALPQE